MPATWSTTWPRRERTKRLAFDRRKAGRDHEPVGLLDQRAELGALLGVGHPFGIGGHRGPLLLTVRGVLVHPDMDVLVHIAGLGGEVGERHPEKEALGSGSVRSEERGVGTEVGGEVKD